MKMLFLQSLQRPKWAASQVALSFSTRGLSTAQWSVTTAASMADMPNRITPDVIFTFVACSSNMLTRVFACVRGLVLPKAVKFVFSSLMLGARRFWSLPTLQMSSPISCSQLFCSPPCACWLAKRGPDNSALDSASLSLPPWLPSVSLGHSGMR